MIQLEEKSSNNLNTIQCNNNNNTKPNNNNSNNNDTIVVVAAENKEYYNFINPLFKRNPICYMKIENSKQLKESLHYAKNVLGKRVSIRSGGHSCCSYSILSDTVNLDLSGLKNIKVNQDEKTVLVESGVTFLQYYKETTKYLLASPGGSCPSVAIGGLSLGGGSNPLSITYGYLVDNILEITVLLANGEFIKCNKSNHSDLFWALRGAGHCSFAIAFEFKIKLNSIQPYFYHNSIELQFDKIMETSEIINEYQKNVMELNGKIYIGLDYRITFKSKRIINTLIFFYHGPIEEGEDEFKKLVTLLKICNPKVQEIGSDKVKKSFLEIIERVPYSNKSRRSFTKSRFSSDLNKTKTESLKLIMEFVPTTLLNKMIVSDVIANFSCSIFFHGGLQNKISNDQCAFVHRGKDCLWSWTFTCTYNTQENDLIFNEWKELINKQLIISFKNLVYPNYPDNEIQNWQQAYYGDNYKRLQQIKKKYDPNDYFKYQQSIELPYQ